MALAGPPYNGNPAAAVKQEPLTERNTPQVPLASTYGSTSVPHGYSGNPRPHPLERSLLERSSLGR